MTLANGKVAVCLEVGFSFVFVCSYVSFFTLTRTPPPLSFLIIQPD